MGHSHFEEVTLIGNSAGTTRCIPSNCGTRPVAIPHGLAGSTGRDFDGRFWKSIINIKIYKSPNEKSRPVGGAHGFGPFGLIQKIPPGQFWIFDHIIILLMQIIYCLISYERRSNWFILKILLHWSSGITIWIYVVAWVC